MSKKRFSLLPLQDDEKESMANVLQPFSEIINEHPALTAEQEQELAQRIQSGDEHAKHTLFNSNIRLASRVAATFFQFSQATFDEQDLIQQALLGLWHACEKYNPVDIRFSTYAVFWIRQYVSRYVNEYAHPVHIPDKTARQVRGEQPVTSNPDVINAARKWLERRCLSLDRPLTCRAEEGEFTLAHFLIAPQPQPQQETISDLQQQVANLPLKDRTVIEMYFGFREEPKSLGEISREMGCSRQRVHQIFNRAMKQLRDHYGVAEALAAAS